MKAPRILFAVCGLFLLGNAPRAFAQDGPQADGNEIQFWTSGGHGANGITQHTGVWTGGFRYGWVITDPIAPKFLRGRFEYAVDAIPVFVVFQPQNTAYGVAIDPFALIWNFDTPGKFVPYIDLDAGALFTNTQVPVGTSRINFTPSAALGVHYLAKKVTWTADLRFVHISNAGLNAVNPGLNTVQLRFGVGWFTHPHH
jgi:hypothetical protein